MLRFLAAASLAVCAVALPADASEFFRPWADDRRAIVLDGYEFNEFDLTEIAKNKRIAAFIHKGSDGVPPAYRCTGTDSAQTICKEKWRRYAVARELFHTRRALARALGLKWGAYHLGRPGDPLEQARHFLDYAEPAEDEAVVIDIEENDPEKWMSLEDAEIFATYIHSRLGRWPMLYTNGNTAKHIADNRDRFPVLSTLPLWYARFKPEIHGHFPKGNWETYAIWQFGSQHNCNPRACLYRVKGANDDIDVNIVDMTVAELKAAWPFSERVKQRLPDVLPIPMARPGEDILQVTVTVAELENADMERLTAAYRDFADSRMVDVTENTSALSPSATPEKTPNDLY